MNVDKKIDLLSFYSRIITDKIKILHHHRYDICCLNIRYGYIVVWNKWCFT